MTNVFRYLILSLLYPYRCDDCGKRIRLFSRDSGMWRYFWVCQSCWDRKWDAAGDAIERRDDERMVANLKRALDQHTAGKGGAS